MAWIAAAASVAGTAINANAKKAQAAAMMGGMPTTEAVFDNSGWNVSIGGGRIDSTAYKTTSQGGTTPEYAAAGGLPVMAATAAGDPTLIYAGLAFLLMMVWKRKS